MLYFCRRRLNTKVAIVAIILLLIFINIVIINVPVTTKKIAPKVQAQNLEQVRRPKVRVPNPEPIREPEIEPKVRVPNPESAREPEIEPKVRVPNPKPVREPVRVHFFHEFDWMNKNNFFKGCEYKCYLTTGQKNYRDSSIVAFYGNFLSRKTAPPYKPRGQIWVYFSLEAPIERHIVLKKWNNLFNWTISHRLDADVTRMYGSFKPRTAPYRSQEITSRFLDKNKTLAWFVSNCKTNSKRELYAKQLSRHVDVDIYGGCGKFKCPRNNNSLCVDMLRRNYKLYLSFENSICRDYATEKCFKVYEENINVIPVTRGPSSASTYSRFLPPHSYINTADFRSIEDLSKHISQIASNENEFLRYFDWRENYESSYDETIFSPYCRLCNMAHNQKHHKRLYSNVGNWAGGNTKDFEKMCAQPTDII